MAEQMIATDKRDDGSFRDPNGFVFFSDGAVYRQVNHNHRQDYDHLIKSGLTLTRPASNVILKHAGLTMTPAVIKQLQLLREEIAIIAGQKAVA